MKIILMERRKKKTIEVDAERKYSSIPVNFIFWIRKHRTWQITQYDCKLHNST
jgi:hypothetical protein